MTSRTQTPEWAIELIEQVCKDYKRTKPGVFLWTSKDRRSTSGTTWYSKTKSGKPIYVYTKNLKRKRFWGKISVNAGTDINDQRLVLLHELAHWVAGKSKSIGHNTKFWKTAYELYERYGVDMNYAFEREKGYKQTAVTVYERYYKKEEA